MAAKLKGTDEVEVLVADLRLIFRALDNARGVAEAWDLLNQFRNLDAAVRLSPLSKAIQQARDRVGGYLEIEEEDDESVS